MSENNEVKTGYSFMTMTHTPRILAMLIHTVKPPAVYVEHDLGEGRRFKSLNKVYLADIGEAEHCREQLESLVAR